MMLLFRMVRYRRFYKEIASLVGEQVYPINSQITHEGQCLLYDQYKTHPKMTTVMEAQTAADTASMELLMLREGDPPTLQLRPYIYDIYRQFYQKLSNKPGKSTKSIPISSRIMDHDLKTKKYIVQQLMKKGYNSFRLVGNSPTEENRLVMERFCLMMGWSGNYSFDKAVREIGQEESQYWVCYVHVKGVRVPINYDSLDKKYLRMLKEAKGGPLRFKEKRVDQEDLEEVVGYDSKAEAQADFFGLDGEVAEPEEETMDYSTKVREILKAKNLQSDEDMVSEIRHLEQQGSKLSPIGYKRLQQLKVAFDNRRRLLG